MLTAKTPRGEQCSKRRGDKKRKVMKEIKKKNVEKRRNLIFVSSTGAGRAWPDKQCVAFYSTKTEKLQRQHHCYMLNTFISLHNLIDTNTYRFKLKLAKTDEEKTSVAFANTITLFMYREHMHIPVYNRSYDSAIR